jgi:hypothetical protein
MAHLDGTDAESAMRQVLDEAVNEAAVLLWIARVMQALALKNSLLTTTLRAIAAG